MHGIAPAEKDAANGTVEKRLRTDVMQFRANFDLKPQESAPFETAIAPSTLGGPCSE
jgi:hypothetical protein